jgi:LemA protein
MGLILAIVFAIGILILMYNSLVAKKNQVDNIFASVDALLKKRYNLIPNLVSSVQEYAKHEKNLLEKITDLRSRAINPAISEAERVSIDKEMTSMLKSIMVAVENYPNLKASENFMHLQRMLSEIEEQISAARRAYNQAVTDYNNAIEMFPTNIMASFIHYKRKALFSIPEDEKINPNIKDLFN